MDIVAISCCVAVVYEAIGYDALSHSYELAVL